MDQGASMTDENLMKRLQEMTQVASLVEKGMLNPELGSKQQEEQKDDVAMTKNEEDEASLLDGEILGDGDEDDQQFKE